MATSLLTTASLVDASTTYQRLGRSAKQRQAIRVYMLILALTENGGTDYSSDLEGLLALYADRETLSKEQLDVFQTAIIHQLATDNGVVAPTEAALVAGTKDLVNVPNLDHIEQGLLNAVLEAVSAPA